MTQRDLAAESGKTETQDQWSLKNRELRKTITVLGALCIFLSTIEFIIPKPLPYLRIGITNLPIMLAVDILPFKKFLVLIAIKVFGQALITGTLFSFIVLFSLAGTLFSALSMYALRRFFGRKRISFIGIGTLGAMVSNISQLTLAWVLIFGDSVRFIAPPFLAAGLVSGVALGFFCELFSRRSQWYAERKVR